MADVETPAAAPSPAAESPSAPAAKPAPVSVPQSSEDYANWRMTGRLPDQKDKASKDDSPPSKRSADDESSEKGAPAPEAGSPRRSNAQTRKEELNREIRELLSKRDSLRQEVEGKKDVKAEPSPAPPTDERPVKPKQADFRTWEEFETAQEKYVEDLAEWTAGKRIREHMAQEQQKAATREMQARLDEAKARYGDEAEPRIIETARTVFDDKQVPPAIKAALGRSQVIVDALYVMGSDKAEFDGFMKLAKEDPLEALRKWYTVEALVKEELSKQAKSSSDDDQGPPRGPNGQFLADKPPPLPRKVSMAPAPAAELNARSSPPVDEVQRSGTAASKSSDPKAVRAYFEAKNRETLAKRRTG